MRVITNFPRCFQFMQKGNHENFQCFCSKLKKFRYMQTGHHELIVVLIFLEGIAQFVTSKTTICQKNARMPVCSKIGLIGTESVVL